MISKDKDFYLWCVETSQRCRELGMHDIAEELDELAGKDADSLESYLRVIGHHLLKLQHAPTSDFARNEKGWRSSVINSRADILRILKRGPALRSKLPGLHKDAFETALKLASSDLPNVKLPKDPPWTHVQLIDHDFWPERK
jgi:hypothetical protein